MTVITDKDGGLATELRAPKGDLPVYLSPSGDRTVWNEIIDIVATGDNIIHTTNTGKKFYIDTLVLVARSAADLLLKSGTTNISGIMSMGANIVLSTRHLDVKLQGRAVTNNFIVNVSGDSGTQPRVSGWATGYEE